MTRNPLSVLFLCTGNCACSIMAEAIINCEGRWKFAGYSAGSRHAGAVHPYAIDLLRQLNHDMDQRRLALAAGAI